MTVPSGLFYGAGLGGFAGWLMASQKNKLSYSAWGAAIGGAVGHIVAGVRPDSLKNLTQPAAAPRKRVRAAPPAESEGLVAIGNVGDFWGDSWAEADDQRFDDSDEFGSSYDLDDYGYGEVGDVGAVGHPRAHKLMHRIHERRQDRRQDRRADAQPPASMAHRDLGRPGAPPPGVDMGRPGFRAWNKPADIGKPGAPPPGHGDLGLPGYGYQGGHPRLQRALAPFGISAFPSHSAAPPTLPLGFAPRLNPTGY